MKKERRFERLCERMMKLSSEDFSQCCLAEGISQIKADNLFYAHFGMSGDEFLNKIRASSIVIAI